MKKTNLSNTETKDISTKIAEQRSALSSFRLATKAGKAKNVKEGKAVRKDIARMLTELRAREIALQNK